LARIGELEVGDLVSHRSRTDDLFIVIGHTYRVSRWGNRRLIRLFCITTGKREFILEEQLVIINPVNGEKDVDNQDNM
jgi:hypothetical protein